MSSHVQSNPDYTLQCPCPEDSRVWLCRACSAELRAAGQQAAGSQSWCCGLFPGSTQSWAFSGETSGLFPLHGMLGMQPLHMQSCPPREGSSVQWTFKD